MLCCLFALTDIAIIYSTAVENSNGYLVAECVRWAGVQKQWDVVRCAVDLACDWL